MADESAASNPLDQLRLTLMQEVLPVGLAMVERAREGGPARVAGCSLQELPILSESYARRGNRQPDLSAISLIR